MSSEQKIKFIFRQIEETTIELTPSQVNQILADYVGEQTDGEEITPEQRKSFNKSIYQLLNRQDQTIVLRQASESTYKLDFDFSDYDNSVSWFDDIAEWFMSKTTKSKITKSKKKNIQSK